MKPLLIHFAGREDLLSLLIRHDQLDPRLDDVERPGREVVPDLVRRDHRAHFDRLARPPVLGRDQFHCDRRALPPFVRDLRDRLIAAKPLLSQLHLLFPACQFQNPQA